MPSSACMIRCRLSSTLFPYTTLFRSSCVELVLDGRVGIDGSERRGIGAETEAASLQDEVGIAAMEDRVPVPAASGILEEVGDRLGRIDRKSTRLNSSHANISYAVFCLYDTLSTEFYTLSLHDALPI